MEPLRDKSNNLCRFFLNGNCTRGDTCNFSHNLSTASSLPGQGAASSTTQPCRFFQRGYCSYGEQCRYAHVGAEASRGPPLSGVESMKGAALRGAGNGGGRGRSRRGAGGDPLAGGAGVSGG